MSLKNLLFWQPKQNLLNLANRSKTGRFLLVTLNYLIWVFFIFLSLKLVKQDANIFWQLFLSTLITEVIERSCKSFFFWSRPICKYKYSLPKGLVKSWYNTGSFPSGHTSKAVFFLLYSIQYAVFPQNQFLLIVAPLLAFRILVGFHYPIDILGGIFVGFFSWLICHNIIFPHIAVNLIQSIFLIFFK